uniref:Uncharacterized protein n=1 Tax=Rhipicephalus appendiculatus TaxID=34631 RepID=A0A131YCD7_RHIAP
MKMTCDHAQRRLLQYPSDNFLTRKCFTPGSTKTSETNFRHGKDVKKNAHDQMSKKKGSVNGSRNHKLWYVTTDAGHAIHCATVTHSEGFRNAPFISNTVLLQCSW